MFSRLEGLAPPEWFSLFLSLSLSLFSRACISVSPLLVPFTFPTLCLGCVPLVWQCLFYISYTLLDHTLGTLAMSVLFSCPTCQHCAWCIYIYICLCMYGWLCTLYDGHLWLHEWPLLITSALDLVVWVSTQGDCCRCVFILYCVHDHHGMIVLIHAT